MNNSINITKINIFPNSLFKLSEETIKQLFYNSIKFYESVYIALGGKSNISINTLFFKKPAHQSKQGLKSSILHINNISKPNAIVLVGLMLEALGDSEYSTRLEITMTIRLKALLKKVETRMIVLDGFQEFIDRSPSEMMHKVANLLNQLTDNAKIVLDVSGSSGSHSNIFQNKQLRYRYLKSHRYVTDLQINSK